MENELATKTTQLNMNFKMQIPDMGQDSIVTTVMPGWKDTRLKIGLMGDGAGVTMRSFGKTMARTAIKADPFAVGNDTFKRIIALVLGRQFGQDRKIIVRKNNMHEVQYTTLANAVDSELGSGFTDEQRNALSIWIAVVLQDAAKMVRWGGPVDIIVSRETERLLATSDMIKTEHLVWCYVNQYESRVKPGMADIMKFMTDKVGYYDVNTIAENLHMQWTHQQIDIRREKGIFAAREVQFRQAQLFLLKGLPTIPDPLSSLADIAEFFKISNYLIDVNFTQQTVIAPRSFAEARSFIQTVRAICASPNAKIKIVSTLSFAEWFTVSTTLSRSGMDQSQLRDISLNYEGSDVVRAGEMVQFMGSYKQWAEDPTLSSTLSALTKNILSNLRKLKDVRLEAWANCVDNMSDVSLWIEDGAGKGRVAEIDKIMQAYAIAGSSFLTRDNEKWVYGILSPTALSLSSSDAAFSIKGSTTRKHEVAVALMLTDRDGKCGRRPLPDQSSRCDAGPVWALSFLSPSASPRRKRA